MIIHSGDKEKEQHNDSLRVLLHTYRYRHKGLPLRQSRRDCIPIDPRPFVNRSMSNPADTQAVNTFELGPLIGDTGPHPTGPTGTISESTNQTMDDSQEPEQSSQDGDELASNENPGNGRRVLGDETNSISREAIQDDAPNLSPSRPLSLQQTRSGVDADRREKQSSEQKGSNAMLNLPPPLPFDLKVSNLWVGVPHSGPSRYVRAACRSASGADM